MADNFDKGFQRFTAGTHFYYLHTICTRKHFTTLLPIRIAFTMSIMVVKLCIPIFKDTNSDIYG